MNGRAETEIHDEKRIDDFRVSVYRVPTDAPESDGTFEWDSTTLILVELGSGDLRGIGFTYGFESLKPLAESLLSKCVKNRMLQNAPEIWCDLVRQVRNEGQVGGTAMAIAAIDIALWDLRAKALGVSLARLLGSVRVSVPIYGSGGFTSYSDDQLRRQFESWKTLGVTRFKMKVGRDSKTDPARVAFAREVIGKEHELFIDANGAYDPGVAISMADVFARSGVTWFEQPIDPNDVHGMHYVRSRLPPGMRLATGEYLYDLSGLRNRLVSAAADFIQLDVTRCKGITGYLKSAATCEAFTTPISSHCAPALHVALGCALPGFRHLEYFHDHARIENLLFEGVPRPNGGELAPDLSRPGLGLVLKTNEAERYRI